jgi:hypothetical protein
LIGPESKEFLVFLFTNLRSDLEEEEPEAEAVAIFNALLDGLDRGAFPDDEKLRVYVAGLAEATDKENEYERVAREHRALAELSDALAHPSAGR